MVGIWREDGIEVEALSPKIRDQVPFREWSNPPCPPPVEGWPHGAVDEDLQFEIGDLESTGAIVTCVLFRPSADQVVLVVAATDVDAVARRLSPQLPNRLCVVPSRFTRDQLDKVHDVLLARRREWRLESFGGGGADEQAQPFTMAAPLRVTTEIAEWADTLPEGLLRLYPTISPA